MSAIFFTIRGFAAATITRACSQLIRPAISASSTDENRPDSSTPTFTRVRATAGGSIASRANHPPVDKP